MANYSIQLKKGKESSILRKHHWIFSGAIQNTPGGIMDGDLVEVFDYKKNKLGTGYFNNGSIAVKMLSFGQNPVNEAHFTFIFQRALDLRKQAGLINNPHTNAYRLIHGEGDLIPGLIIDNYNGHLVLQIHHVYMLQNLEMILAALRTAIKDIKSIYLKFTQKFRADVDPFVEGKTEETEILENDIRFNVNWVTGQKTGFFLDQRDNRSLLGKYSEGKDVLNTFCFTGGFSLYAMQSKAKSVTSVDSSASAMEGLQNNLQLNPSGVPHQSITGDALEYLTKMDGAFDLIVLDPPAFAKSISARHNAIMAYKRINALAIQKIKPGGILFTYSCSQVVNRAAFTGAVLSAAIESGREITIIHQLSQPADHPVNIFHPETEYLKGLVVYVK